MNAFAAYAAEVALLADKPDPLPALLLSRHGAGPWRRTYARFHPQQPSYCTLLYETSGAGGSAMPLRVSLYRDADASSVARGEAVAGLGIARVTPPAEDEALQTLHAVLARHPDAAIVRYRPLHRCTFRAAHAAAGAQYVKVFPSGFVQRLHTAMQSLWHRRGELAFAVAEPLAFDGDLRFVSQAALPGTPLVAELLGARGLEVAAAAGRAAATLPQSSVPAAQPLSSDEILANTENHVHAIAALLPEHAERLRALLSRLRRDEAACAPARRLPIHGALHPAQWLRVGNGLGLVDFDGLAAGDPEFDVATFVTELRYEQSAMLPPTELCRAFTDAYAECVPLDAQRVALYVAHKEIAKLLRLARAPRPDAPRRFALALQRMA